MILSNKETPYIQLPPLYKPENIYPGIPEEFSLKYNIVPLWVEEDVYVIATADASFNRVDEIEMLVKKPLKVFLSTYPQIRSIQHQLYGNRHQGKQIFDPSLITKTLNGDMINAAKIETDQLSQKKMIPLK